MDFGGRHEGVLWAKNGINEGGDSDVSRLRKEKAFRDWIANG